MLNPYTCTLYIQGSLKHAWHLGIGFWDAKQRKCYADRQQVVNINGVTSSPGYAKCGVPQGRILGTLLCTPVSVLTVS